MSDFGIYMLLFVGILMLVGLIKFLAWLTELQETHGSLGQAAVNSFKRYTSTPTRVMSRKIPQTSTDEQTDEQTDLVSEANQWLDRLGVDRTKTALIEILVYSGWDVGQIRGVVKGDNGAIGLEIEAARKRLGIAPEPPRQLRVRDNGSDVRLIPMEVE
jgi:hypothetical protein